MVGHLLLVCGCGEGMFQEGGGEQTFFMGKWGWVDIFYELVGVGGGGRRYILGGQGWMGVSQCEWTWSLVLV